MNRSRAARLESWHLRKKNRASTSGVLLILLPVILCVLAFYYSPAADASGRHLLSECQQGEQNHTGEAFPHELFTQEQKDSGAIVLYIVGAIYSFIGLSIVCDVHFEPSLDAISDNLGLSEDVAGATFMAAGSSAPELFTSLMGVFVARSDVGIGTIVGSAVFNMLVIIGICGIFVGKWSTPEKPINIQMNWYVAFRDIFFYCISILILIWCLQDQEVDAVQSFILFFLYVLYVLWMKFNESIGKYAQRTLDNYLAGQQSTDHAWAPSACQKTCQAIVESKPFELVMYVIILANTIMVVMQWAGNDNALLDTLNLVCVVIYFVELVLKLYSFQFVGYFLDTWNLLDFILVGMIVLELILSGAGQVSSASRGLRLARFARGFRGVRALRLARATQAQTKPKLGRKEKDAAKEKDAIKEKDAGKVDDAIPMDELSAKPDTADAEAPDPEVVDNQQTKAPMDELSAKPDTGDTEAQDTEVVDNKQTNDDYEEPDSPWDMPEGSWIDKFYWWASWPVYTSMYYTVPPCGADGWKKWYLVSFINSILWISVYCYLMVWMSTVLGETFRIPSPVMGLTFLAAGTSLPDAMASLGVAQKGKADQAVANANGSNVFDICIGLAFPWFFACVTNFTGTGVVTVHSEALTLTVFVLFIVVALTLLVMKVEEWKLSSRLGYILCGVYGIFVIESLLLEYGVICI